MSKILKGEIKMNGKIRQQILELIEAKKQCVITTKRMKKMTMNSKEYIDDTIRIFNENNDTTDILQRFKETETILDEYAVLKKFHNNSYIIFYIYRDVFSTMTSWEQGWDFENKIELYSNTILYKDTNKKTELMRINVNSSICIKVGLSEILTVYRDCDGAFKDFSSKINDEKIILEFLSVATKMIEMYADAQEEFTEILVKLKEEKYRKILNAVWE